ncbi:MAG: hypothetical protein WC748_08025 [Legionellales bacterium]|jgi:hypothetical protein
MSRKTKKVKADKFILEPYVEIADRDKWLFDNKTALEKVRKGLKQASEGQVKSQGSFS